MKPSRDGGGSGLATRAQADDHFETGVPQVQGMRAALTAVAENREAFAGERADLYIRFRE